jgi:RNA methyltransferase, TrmH family
VLPLRPPLPELPVHGSLAPLDNRGGSHAPLSDTGGSHAPLSDNNARLVAARRLTSRRGRRDAGRFLVEGAQAVREALLAPGAVLEVFATSEALGRNADLLRGVTVAEVSARAAAALSETVTPQGLVAVCRRVDVTLDDVFARRPLLVAVLVDSNDPGNAGTVLRTADAAGAEAVILAGGVDIYNGKAVRATAGSMFHLDVVIDAAVEDVIGAARAAGLTTIAATGAASRDLDELAADGTLCDATLWLFGSEAHGLPADVIQAADVSVRVPIHGRAESLNLAAAAAVCLYASARQRRLAPG